MEGVGIYYYPNGLKEIYGKYQNDVRHGIWVYYNEDGSTKKKEEYKFGRRIDENKDDGLINPDTLLREKQDYLEFEDLFKKN